MREGRHRIAPAQTARVNRLRRESTAPERLLWSRLRAGQLNGLKFRRQAALGPFIVDFYCPAAMLIVELDGMSHDGRRTYDAARTAFLKERGLRVVRYTNDDVLRNVDAVADDIARHATSR
jgi:very-short-patch-repair endonuclease